MVDVVFDGWKLRLITCHMPHGGDSDAGYAATLSILEKTVQHARRHKCTSIVGVDANAIIGQQSLHDHGKIIGQWGLGERNERGMILASWLHTTRLSVASTMFKKQYSQQWSHQLWSTGVRRLVDYVFVDTCSKQSLSDACAGDELAASSDHRAVMATF